MDREETFHESLGGSNFYFHGVKINKVYFYNGTDSGNHSSEKSTTVDKSNLSDEQIARAIEAICGEGKPLDSKRKWAAVYWCLRWYCNFPVKPKDFCDRIEKMQMGDLPYQCEYDCIRHFSTLSFMNQDARQIDKVKASRTDEQFYQKCRVIVLALAEELGKSSRNY